MSELVLVVPEIDTLVVDSIFPTPGRNDLCHCTSGKKYKKCHEEIDEKAWRFIALKTHQADAACMLLRAFKSNYPLYDPEPLREPIDYYDD